MDPSSIWLLIAVIVLIFLSAIFSASETAFSSLNRIRIKNLAQDGSKKAIRTLKMVENYDKLLTTILIGNNIVNIVAASLFTVFFTKVMPQHPDLGVMLSTIILTVMVLIFGEISPKSIAKESPETFAMFISPVINILVVLFTPINWLFMQWKKLLNLMFKSKADRGMSEQELITLVDEATSGGDIGEEEGELIRSAIEFNELMVKDIYTPRVDIDACPLTANKEDIRAVFADTGFSRIPIFDKDIDEIVGVLHEKDFYRGYFDKDFNVESLMSTIECVTLSTNIANVLKLLQSKKTHMAVVIDEYGGTAGIVTLEDIIEELVGEIWDEHDEVSEEIIANEDGSYTVKGSCSIEDLFDYFNIKFNDDDMDITTVSGWAIEECGHMPQIGDHFIDGRLKVEVVATDFRRIEVVRIELLPENFKSDDSEHDNIDATAE